MQDHGGQADVRVFIVAGLRLFRDGLVMTLALEGWSLGGGRSAGSLVDAVSALPAAKPSVILIDLSPPDGLTAIARLARYDGAKVVAIGVPDQPEIVACAEAGASAYVTKREQPLSFLTPTRSSPSSAARRSAARAWRRASCAGWRRLRGSARPGSPTRG